MPANPRHKLLMLAHQQEPVAASVRLAVMPAYASIPNQFPVPDSEMDCGLFCALSVMVTVPEYVVPFAGGVNVT